MSHLVNAKGERQPRLCIGVPVYNGEEFLRRTVESLLNQSFDDFELIISDNASTDTTEAIGRSLSKQDPRVRYVRQKKNLGLAGNYNWLFGEGRGPYFKWATSDDPCEPRFLEQCIGILESDPGVVLAHCRAQFVDQDERRLDIDDPGFSLDFEPASERLRYIATAGHWVNAILGVIRTQAIAKTRLLPSYAGGDYVLLGELGLQGRFVEIPEALLLRRIHPSASSQLVDDPEKLHHHIVGKSGPSLPAWSRLRDHARTVLFSNLSIAEKASLMLVLLRQARWGGRRLMGELGQAGRILLGLRRRSRR